MCNVDFDFYKKKNHDIFLICKHRCDSYIRQLQKGFEKQYKNLLQPIKEYYRLLKIQTDEFEGARHIETGMFCKLKNCYN